MIVRLLLKVPRWLKLSLILVLVSVLGFILILLFFSPDKSVKIRARSFTTSIDKNEVARLLGNALASENATTVLGSKTPIEVKKEGSIQKAEFPFNAIAPTWQVDAPGGTEVIFQVRASKDGQNWSEWKTVEEDEDGDAKDNVTSARIFGRLVVIEGEYIQERVIFRTSNLEKIPEVKNLEFTYIDSKEKLNFLERILKKTKLEVSKVFAASGVPKRPTDQPTICSRSCWGADESLRTWDPHYSPLKKMVVHHTVTSNNDPNPKATIRAIYYFHAVTRGWGDIGYNFLVDQNNGVTYEGRYGGDKVIGAHVRGYNTGSVGVGVLGDFRFVGVNKKVQNALHKIAVWRFYTHKIDPDKVSYFGNPSKKLPSVFYHGQVANTLCAGTHMNNFVPSLKKLAHYLPQQIILRTSSGTQRIEGGNDKTVADLLVAYKNKGVVAPNYIREISVFPTDGTTSPDDPNYSDQWALAKLDALNVWKETTGGDTSVKVAVIDTGVAYETYDPPGLENYAKGPDFANTNFVSGFDYVNNDTHPNDDHGHGTVAASVIAESTNNSLGSAALAYNVSIMPVKVCDKNGWCTDNDLAKGIDFARSNGAKVVNISFGGDDHSDVVQAAIDAAWDDGIVMVGASGNDGTNKIYYPARGKHVIGVGALTSSDSRASYSNYGSGLDLMAPGGDARGGSGDLFYQKLSCTASLNCTSFSYGRVAGTSFSTALVSASAALIVSKGAVWPVSVERFLKLKAKDLGSGGPDSVYGWGRIRPFNSFEISTNNKPHLNGTLLRVKNKAPVYLLENDQKRWIPSISIFKERFRWKNVIIISNFEMGTYAQGPNAPYPDGTLLKGSSKNVYVLSNGQKRWITSASVFDTLGYKWRNIIDVSDSELSNYSTGANISTTNTHPDGSLLISNQTKRVYLIDGGQKRWVPNLSIFASRFFWEDVISIIHSELESYDLGSNITYPDGSLIKSPNDPKVYFISTASGGSQQTKHWIRSSLTFDSLGFKWRNLQYTSDSIINSFAGGDTIY